MTSQTTQSHADAPTGPGARVRTRLVGVAAATAAALVVWGIADLVLGVDLLVDSGSGAASPMKVGPGAVVATAVIASLAGWALLAVLERLVARPAQVWTVIAVAAALLSLAGPVAGGLRTASTVVLGAMHIAVAAVLIPMLRGTVAARGGVR